MGGTGCWRDVDDGWRLLLEGTAAATLVHTKDKLDASSVVSAHANAGNAVATH